MAPKEEAYFKMFAVDDLQSPAMKDDSSRLVSKLHSFSNLKGEIKVDLFKIINKIYVEQLESQERRYSGRIDR